ncbi:MAG: molybdenum cofactor guanylyltransferase [Acidobacteria bacterium]|nr:molybdenum cofactor guanylyltransferase [Acidobacteriota bacterium]
MEQQRDQSQTEATPIPFTGYVLAGGQSTRMGRDKALLEIGGQPLIRSAVNLLKALTGRVAILGPAENYSFLGVPVLPDLVPSRGPLSAIYTGLERSGTTVNLFLACDMPLMEGTFLKLLVERALLADAVLMRLDDGSLEPLCAVYNRSCLPTVKANYENRRFKLSDLFPKLRTQYLTESDLQDLGLDRRIFTNLNDPGDLEQWGISVTGKCEKASSSAAEE